MNLIVSQGALRREGPSASRPDRPFSAGLDWVAIEAPTRAVLDACKRRVARLGVELGPFIRIERLDAAEAEVLAAMQELRELRLQLRGMRAQAKAERRG
jgi:hypothetical protein